MATERVRLGHMVICTGFRNPALTAKLASTIDVISGGRFELGIGAGWKDDEWIAYGFGFPATNERLARLGDDLEVITRMLAPGRATYEGKYASVRDAINEPKGVQDHIPIIVGGNGPNVTMRLAARFADELNLVFRPPDEIPGLMATARQRCEEIDRDPSTLRLSMYVADDEVKEPGQKRVDVHRPADGDGPRPTRRLPDALRRDARGPGALRRGLPGGGPPARDAARARRGELSRQQAGAQRRSVGAGHLVIWQRDAAAVQGAGDAPLVSKLIESTIASSSARSCALVSG